ncbi:uncharacterized protein LOC134179860 isoform X2 [Corticium candelabrum]|uniref:uncharacterized protein LOC134179860 isoform X2 n=1 Tax=Corticium candelabrum TaxID=121492 RepID=UPI002E252EFD|nr:uncharacterized protein LOC134179860 isoform X2 [Corticium candelabrum]
MTYSTICEMNDQVSVCIFTALQHQCAVNERLKRTGIQCRQFAIGDTKLKLCSKPSLCTDKCWYLIPIHRSFNCKDYWHPEDIPWILESFDKLLKFGHVIWMCHRILHDGKWKWIQAQSRVVANQYLDTTVSFVSEEVGKRALMLRGSHERENSSSGVEAYLSQQTVASLSLQIDGFSDCYLEKPVPSMSPAYLSDNYSMSEETARFHNSKDAQPLQPNLSDNAQSRNSLFSRSSLRHSLTSQCAPLQQLHKTHCSPAENCFTDTSCRWSCSDCSSTSTMSHGEVDSLFGGFDCLDDDPNLGIESVIVNSNVVKIEFPSWNLHCPTYAMSSGSSVNDSLVTSNQETISDSVSKRHLVDTACISVPPKFTWCPAPTRNLFMDTSHQHFGYFNERQPAPMFSEAVFAEKWNERSHTHSGSVLTDDLRSTDVTTFCSISTCAHHPVYAIQMPNSTPETETDRAIEDVCNEDFGDLQPLTWDWTVGIDVNTALHQDKTTCY